MTFGKFFTSKFFCSQSSSFRSTRNDSGNKRREKMKALMVALIASVSMNAFAGGRYVTVRVCDGGESGTECRTVTYKVRHGHGHAAGSYQECSAEGTPCAPAHYGIPHWLRALNDLFPGHGPSDRNADDTMNAGG
jgi:hypothetical protein